jgi:hypothetical protein
VILALAVSGAAAGMATYGTSAAVHDDEFSARRLATATAVGAAASVLTAGIGKGLGAVAARAVVSRGASAVAEGAAGSAGRAAAPAARDLAESGASKTTTRAATNSGEGLLSTAARGSGSRVPMNMQSVCETACKYGIDISDVSIKIDKSRAGSAGITRADQSVTLTGSAFTNEEQLARTLFHERFHVDQIRSGMYYSCGSRNLS